MFSARKLGIAGMWLLTQGSVQPASANALSDAVMQLPIYLCQLGDALHAYAFGQASDESWIGLGQLQGWNVTMQSDGLVARQADDVLILGESGASLVEQGHVMTGKCTDPRPELAQLFASDDLYQTLLADVGSEVTARFPDDMFSFIEPATWDAEKVLALVDALELDNSVGLQLKNMVAEAGNDPVRIAEVSRQIRRALVSDIMTSGQLRAQMREANRNLEAVTAALNDERQVAQNAAARLAETEARASEAERLNNRAAAQYADAQNTLREKDAALKRFAHETSALQQQLTTVQHQAQQLQSALDEETRRKQTAYAQNDALSAQLAEMRARLVRANKKIDQLKAGGN